MKNRWLAGACVVSLASLLAACGGSPADEGKSFDNGAAGSTSGGNGTSGTAAYPAGPYGSEIGSTVQNLEFLGWQNPAAAGFDPSKFKPIRLSDYYNPDGTKPAKALMINVSARWCVVCKGEYADFRASSRYESLKAKGVEFVGVLFEDANQEPAKPADVQWWAQTYQVEFPFLIDPGFKMGAYFSADATPLNMVVDTRTMKITAKVLGYDPSSSDLWDQVDAVVGAK